MDLGRKWLVDLNTGKTQLVLFDQSNNTGAIDVKMDWSFLEEKSSFEMLGLSFSSKLDWKCYFVSVAKTASKKTGDMIHFMEFEVAPEVAMCGLVLLTVTWKCWISDKNVTGVLVLPFLKSFG